MGRAPVAWILLFSTGLSGCAMRRDAAVVSGPEAASDVQARLDGYPSGARVRRGLAGGERIEGVLLWAESESRHGPNAASIAWRLPKARDSLAS